MLSSFKADYLEIEPYEIADHLLRESGQYEREAVNPKDLLDLLGLRHLSFDFDRELPTDVLAGRKRPRALLSFADRLTATHSDLSDSRLRFSLLHEIAHYVLPSHVSRLYLCDEEGLGAFASRITFEKEANDFAAELLFKGAQFALEVNSSEIAAKAVKRLAERYRASFEATARRMVEKNVRPCMLVVFQKRNDAARVDLDRPATWEVRYCVGSASFKTAYSRHVTGSVPPEIAVKLGQPGTDVSESVCQAITLHRPAGEAVVLNGAFFTNRYSIFCLLTPARRPSTVSRAW